MRMLHSGNNYHYSWYHKTAYLEFLSHLRKTKLLHQLQDLFLRFLVELFKIVLGVTLQSVTIEGMYLECSLGCEVQAAYWTKHFLSCVWVHSCVNEFVIFKRPA